MPLWHRAALPGAGYIGVACPSRPCPAASKVRPGRSTLACFLGSVLFVSCFFLSATRLLHPQIVTTNTHMVRTVGLSFLCAFWSALQLKYFSKIFSHVTSTVCFVGRNAVSSPALYWPETCVFRPSLSLSPHPRSVSGSVDLNPLHGDEGQSQQGWEA